MEINKMLKIVDIAEVKEAKKDRIILSKIQKTDTVEIKESVIKELQNEAYFYRRAAIRNPHDERAAAIADTYESILERLVANQYWR